MTKKEFAALTAERMLFLDGATGSNLMRAGMPSGVCPEVWILENREILIRLQEEYVKAGSHILYAPTFSANRIKLDEYGLKEKQREMILELVGLSRQAAGDRAFVAGDLTMTGEQLAPIGTLKLEELIDIYKEQIGYLVEAGVDLLVVETMMSLQETRAALIAAKETCDLPVLVTMTFESDGRTLYGTDALTAAVVLSSLGADAVGLNCSTGPDKMVELIRSMAQAVKVPVIAKPNAGLPFVDGEGRTCYDMDAAAFTEYMGALIDAGATILGGCCGTTPEFISRLSESYKALNPKAYRTSHCNYKRYLTSERKTLSFTLDSGFIVVGERINPTGKKKLQEELRQNITDRVLQFTQEQEAAGAGILDINVGMSGIDEKQVMLQALETVTEATSLPLAIDSSHVEVLEAALRHFPGRALVNSVSLEKGKPEKLLPLIKKYGAMFILLPLSDKGLPENQEEKIHIIDTIVDRALSLGMEKEDIVVDGLVATVGANPAAALETLETIRYCQANGLATICGLSNISFGLPERSFVNTAFLTMAIQAGLSMAIANPSQELLMNCAMASDLLLHKEGADMRYISHMEVWKAAQPQAQTGAAAGHAINGERKPADSKAPVVLEETDPLDKVREAVLKGNKRTIVELTQKALDTGRPAGEILNEALLPGINEVGELFDQGKYFLPQLIAGAEAMKLAIEFLEPMLLEAGDRKVLPTVVIACKGRYS